MTTVLTGIQRRGTSRIIMATYAGGVATEVRARMARLDVTQKQLADALGVSQVAVSRRLRGLVPFDVVELAATAALLGCRVADLLPDDDGLDPVREVQARNAGTATNRYADVIGIAA